MTFGKKNTLSEKSKTLIIEAIGWVLKSEGISHQEIFIKVGDENSKAQIHFLDKREFDLKNVDVKIDLENLIKGILQK